MKTILTVNAWGDYGSYILGICTTPEKAEKIIKDYVNEFSIKNLILKEVTPGKFKVASKNNYNDYDYWIKEVKLNKKL